jgi:DNA-3-methyladenine glycosylase I
VIRNAAAALTIPDGLAALVWSYAGDPAGQGPGPLTTADLTATTAQSTALSKDLRRRGFAFTGPVTVYAMFQACGLVDDHLQACFCRGEERSATVGH